MFIFNFVVQFLYKRHFRSKIGDIAPLTSFMEETNHKIVVYRQYIDLFCGMITTSTALLIEAIKYNVQPQIFTSRQKGVNTIIGRPKLVLFKWLS
jgi:hypothetical protein